MATRALVSVDALSSDAGLSEALQRDAALFHLDLPTGLRWEEGEREELAAIARDLALGVVVAAVQDLAAVPPPADGPQSAEKQNAATLAAYAHTAARMAMLRAWVDGDATFPARDTTLGAAWAELPAMFDRDRRKAWAARCTLRKVYAGALGKLLDYLQGGGTPARSHARWVICLRYTGMTGASWEDLSLMHHTSERVMRREMAAVGLPSFHV